MLTTTTTSYSRREILDAIIVLSFIVIPCFLSIHYIMYSRYQPYQQRGIETTGFFYGKESTYLPFVPSSHSADISFSTGNILEGTYQVYLATADNANPSFLKTLERQDEIQLIYLPEDPKNTVILKNSLDTYLHARQIWFNKYFGVEVIFASLAIYAWIEKRRLS